MQIVYFAVPLSLLLILLAVVAFVYAIRSKQYDDLEGDAQRIVLDDRELQREIANKHTTQSGKQDDGMV